jgi:hypothetical protein
MQLNSEVFLTSEIIAGPYMLLYLYYYHNLATINSRLDTTAPGALNA